MIFKKLREAREHFRRYIPVDKSTSGRWFYRSQLLIPMGLNFGDWILFQHIVNGLTVSCPIYGIFTGWKIWDQALVINFVEKERAWMNNNEVVTNEDINYTMHINHLDDEVQAIQFWTDDIVLLGHWKDKPAINQLKQALKTKL
jgi:hypothetical protein